MLAWKIRVAVLWISVAVVNTAVMFLSLFEPGAVRDLIAGEWLGADARSGTVQVAVVFNLVAPPAMSYLTLVLRDGPDRVLTAVVGALATVSAVLSLVGLVAGSYGAGMVFAALVGTAVGLLILWHAWKWPAPRESATETGRRRADAGV